MRVGATGRAVEVLAGRASWTVEHTHVMDGLRALPDGSVSMICTSPPYWGLRNYGVDGQLGLERSAACYVQQMIDVFREGVRCSGADLENSGTGPGAEFQRLSKECPLFAPMKSQRYE